MSELSVQYEALQAAFIAAYGIREGSRVRILRTAKDGEAGWANSWVSNMTQRVGQIAVVSVIHEGASGICLRSVDNDGEYAYPFFVLKSVEDIEKPSIVTLNSDYKAYIFKDHVKVGCQRIEFDAIRELYNSLPDVSAKPVPPKYYRVLGNNEDGNCFRIGSIVELQGDRGKGQACYQGISPSLGSVVVQTLCHENVEPVRTPVYRVKKQENHYFPIGSLVESYGYKTYKGVVFKHSGNNFHREKGSIRVQSASPESFERVQ